VESAGWAGHTRSKIVSDPVFTDPVFTVVRNGDLCRLSRWGVDRLGQIETGRLTRQADGRLAPVSDDLLQEMRAKAN
ncbi:MAG: metallo-beta-lactamase family protein, partial [Proteobacteria bacterium]|nr:metallo-beta-lactamase family protein [Pseudomonadota bacterium]